MFPTCLIRNDWLQPATKSYTLVHSHNVEICHSSLHTSKSLLDLLMCIIKTTFSQLCQINGVSLTTNSSDLTHLFLTWLLQSSTIFSKSIHSLTCLPTPTETYAAQHKPCLCSALHICFDAVSDVFCLQLL